MEAYFARRDIHHLAHGARNRAVRASLPEIVLPYANLQELSRIARYGPRGHLTAADYDVALSDLALIDAELQSRL